MKIYEKLFNLQNKVGILTKDKTNPFYKSAYLDINTIIEVLKPILNEEKLVITQPLGNKDGKATIATIIADVESDEKVESEVILPENPDPQKMGAIITYFRRYALQSLLFLQAEDDDANSAITPKTPYKAPQTPPKPIVPHTKQPFGKNEKKFISDMDYGN